MVRGAGKIAVFDADNWRTGLALQMIVQGDDITTALGQDAIDSIGEECRVWEDDVAKGGIFPQDDSGI